MLDSLSPARRRFVLVLAVMAVAAVVAVATVLVANRESAVDPVSQAEQGPVLIVPGYGGSTGALTELSAALDADGRDVTVVALAGDGRGDLEAQALMLDQAVAAATARDSPGGWLLRSATPVRTRSRLSLQRVRSQSDQPVGSAGSWRDGSCVVSVTRRG